MDQILQFLSEYATSLTYERLPQEVVHHVKRRTIDALGCALGGYYAEPPKIARVHALQVGVNPGATVLGTDFRTTPDLAAFANGVMVRYLDFNDTSMAFDGGHPSDNIPPVLAAAEYAGADVKTAIVAITLAYEVQDRLGDVSGIFKRGWDHTTYVALSSAAGAAKALGLTKDQIANALALAGASNVALGQIRVGGLSMLKGCAAGNASRNGVFAALMARQGLTGPSEVFTGSRGFFKQLSGGPVELPPFGGSGRRFKVQDAKYKYFPTDYEAQCSIHPALELRQAIGGKVDEIEKMTIDTYDLAVDIAADSPEKWNPSSRETADHSIPFVQAVALTKGDVWLDDFTEERIRDPKLRALMQKIEVRRNDKFTQDYPDSYWFRIELLTRSGERHVREIRYAKGHPKNPMTDQEIEAKFRRLAEPLMKPSQINNILKQLWQLEKVSNLREIMTLFKLQA